VERKDILLPGESSSPPSGCRLRFGLPAVVDGGKAKARNKYEPCARLDFVPKLSEGMKVQVSSRHDGKNTCQYSKNGYCLGVVQKENEDGTFDIFHGGHDAEVSTKKDESTAPETAEGCEDSGGIPIVKKEKVKMHARVERHDIMVEDGSDLGTATATRIDAVFRNKVGGSFEHRMLVNGKECASWVLQEEQTGGNSSNSFRGMRATRARTASNDTFEGHQAMKRSKTPDDREKITLSFVFDEPTHVRTVHLRSTQPINRHSNDFLSITVKDSSNKEGSFIRRRTVANQTEEKAVEDNSFGWESIKVYGRKDVSSRLCISCGDEDFTDSNTGQLWHKIDKYDCTSWGGYLNNSAELTITALKKSKQMHKDLNIYREALNELKQQLKIEYGEATEAKTIASGKTRGEVDSKDRGLQQDLRARLDEVSHL
jgi:hypothetical protein